MLPVLKNTILSKDFEWGSPKEDGSPPQRYFLFDKLSIPMCDNAPSYEGLCLRGKEVRKYEFLKKDEEVKTMISLSQKMLNVYENGRGNNFPACGNIAWAQWFMNPADWPKEFKESLPKDWTKPSKGPSKKKKAKKL